MSLTERLDAFQRRHRWAGFPLGVIYKFVDDQGPYLAALITYYGFLSIFPLLLLLISVLGFVFENRPDLQEQFLNSALSQFPVIGEQLEQPQGLQGSVIAIAVGGLIALYGALGVAQAIQNASYVTWAVPRHRRPNPFRARLRSLGLVAVFGLGVIVTTILSTFGSNAEAFGTSVRGRTTLGAVVVSIVVNWAVFLAMFRIFRPTQVRRRDIVPGALVAAVIWQLLQWYGAGIVGNAVQRAGESYGGFALVLGLLAWIYVAALGVVFGSEINVVRAKRLYPRALLTPFTDNVNLTDADVRAYDDAVSAQKFKGFQSVTVAYENDGQHATARQARTAAEAASPATEAPEVPPEPSPE
ncbi:MAG TPA: YihY/virulence factor BrkB family protein [Ilumatobacter sp.]|nr:YihY/virulence factor BrkB family protein [Ilumatobacter sp.]